MVHFWEEDHVMSCLHLRILGNPNARGSSRTRVDRTECPEDRTERPQTECHRIRALPNTRICRNTRKSTQYVIYSGPSTEYANTQANMKKYENAQYVSTVVILFIIILFFQFSDVASFASIPRGI